MGKDNTLIAIEELERLNKLLELGVITKAEYNAKKQEILEPYNAFSPKKKSINKKVIFWLGGVAIALTLVCVLLFVPKFGIRCKVFGHDPSAHTQILKEPGCVEDGLAVRYCMICGRQVEEIVLPKKGFHHFVNGVCTDCGAKDPNYVSNTVQFKVRTLVEMHVRKGPGLSYDVIRNLPFYSVVSVYETKTGDGYTWVRIAPGEWIANDGTWLEYVD